MGERLRLVIRTPHEVVFDEGVDSARFPSDTGQVGVRPRGEPFRTSVEPGLILLRTGDEVRFAASAGGLFDGDRELGVLYTPFAVTGAEPDEVLEEMDRALAMPDSEIAARRRLGELEERIIEELRARSSPGARAPSHDV